MMYSNIGLSFRWTLPLSALLLAENEMVPNFSQLNVAKSLIFINVLYCSKKYNLIDEENVPFRKPLYFLI